MQRFFFNTQPLIPGRLQISQKTLLHHFFVLRLQQGDQIKLFDGKGNESQATILEIKKQTAIIEILKIKTINRELPYKTKLLQGLCSNEKMDWIIEKAVELGISNIQPIICRKSLTKLSETKSSLRLVHWQKRIISACEQCGRNVVPTISLPLHFIHWTNTELISKPRNHNKQYYILSPGTLNSFSSIIPPIYPEEVEILIGPEGGFTNEEIELAKLRGYKMVTMGPRILRTETAGITILAALAAHWQVF